MEYEDVINNLDVVSDFILNNHKNDGWHKKQIVITSLSKIEDQNSLYNKWKNEMMALSNLFWTLLLYWSPFIPDDNG